MKYTLAILNSRLIRYCYFDTKNGNAYLDDEHFGFKLPLDTIPVIKLSDTKPFEILTDYILFLKSIPKEQRLDEYVPNTHIIKQFNDVIDNMVYEIYFANEFKAKNIDFIKYATEDFKSIDNMGKESTLKTIKDAYLELCETKNPIRNNILLVPVEFDFIRTILWS